MAQLFEIIPNDMAVEYTVSQAVAIAASMHIKIMKSIAPIKEAFGIIKLDYCRKAAAETLVSMCTSTLELCDPSLAESRLAAIDACCIVARSFLPLSPSVEKTLDIVNRLLQLQKSYSIMLPYSELTNRRKDAAEGRFLEYCTGTPLKTFEEIVRFGELLSIKKERICELAFNSNMLASPETLETALFLIGDTTDELDKSALDRSINFIRQMFFVLHQYASDRCRLFGPQHATFIIDFFKRLKPCLLKLTDTALQLELPFETDLLFYVQEFVSLFEQTLKCLTDMPGDADRSLTDSFSAENVEKEESKIYEMSHRWGVLNPARVGSIFDSVEVIKVLGRVGYSIFMKPNGDDTLLDVTTTDASMFDFWEDVFLCCNGNPYLKLIAQNFAFRLRKFFLI
uniref:Uncharacterized protein n=1 Tax=Panagrolaimus superbus TaxID=310955 RepID=A0A914XXJ6_9BILA